MLCLGNITDRPTVAYLNNLSEEFLPVKGEFDDPVIYLPSPETAGNKKTISSSVSGQYGSKPNDGQIAVGSLGHSTIGAAGTSGAAAFGVSAPSYLSNAPDGATLNTLDKVSGANESPVGAGNGNTSSASRGQPISLPLSRVVTLGSLRVGFNSGHTIVPNSDPDALLIAARQLDVDIFIWGGTHRVEAYQLEGKFFVNPGSATGAFYTGWPDNEDLEDEEGEGEESTKKEANGDTEKSEGKEEEEEDPKDPKDPIPSFCLFDIQGSVCVVYIYRYVDGEVKVDKINYQKETTEE